MRQVPLAKPLQRSVPGRPFPGAILLLTLLATPAAVGVAAATPGPAPAPVSAVGAPPKEAGAKVAPGSAQAASPVAAQPAGAVRGRVRAARSPLGRASVFAFELARSTMQKVTTGADGEFHFDALPAGVYKLIAFKPGYQPAVILLSRAAAEALQFVEMNLAQEPAKGVGAEDFWAVRDQIPPDVLRDLEGLELAELAGPVPTTLSKAASPGVKTSFRAATGVQSTGFGGAAQLAGGGIGMEGSIGSMKLGVNGEFWRLEGQPDVAAGASAGQAAALAVRMAGNGEGQIDVTTVSQKLFDPLAVQDSADFERYRVSWSQPMGDRSRSHFTAQYTAQSNFLRPVVPLLPVSDSRAINVEGGYSIELSDRSTLETGIRFRERDGGTRSPATDQERAVELFGKGGWQLQPSVLVEYGMFTQLRDGSLSLAPEGGLVVQLGDHWQAVTMASHRIESGVAAPLDGFTPIRFASMGQDASGMGCHDLEQHCYRVLLARQGDEDGETFAIGAVHRELAETLHLYFDDDFLNQFESLYLVQGDKLPEVQMVFARRVTPHVVAKLESSYSSGGGGILWAQDTAKAYHPLGQHAAYENRVSYLVTSLDTHFTDTSTGVFLAFHHLAQGVTPVDGKAVAIPVQELERLQLMISQDLSVLMRLAADWSLHLNLEVSRGSLPFTLRDAPPDEVRRRVTGGLTVRF